MFQDRCYERDVDINNNFFADNMTNNMETDLLGNLVNNIKTYSNGAKNDYNYGMSY